MKFFQYMKDGGPESTVSGLFFIEIKGWFTVVLLHFGPGSRDAYHSHAFNAVSWVLRGKLVELVWQNTELPGSDIYTPSLRPIVTRRDRFHQVKSVGHTWVLSFRGPWSATWWEYLPKRAKFIQLTHGRKIVKS